MRAKQDVITGTALFMFTAGMLIAAALIVYYILYG